MNEEEKLVGIANTCIQYEIHHLHVMPVSNIYKKDFFWTHFCMLTDFHQSKLLKWNTIWFTVFVLVLQISQ